MNDKTSGGIGRHSDILSELETHSSRVFTLAVTKCRFESHLAFRNKRMSNFKLK
jgi:hypothetical protein|nr:MAG TPA: hypothetical protein [Caudoviricetes sp.]